MSGPTSNVRTLLKIVIRLLLCAAAVYVVWQWLGLIAVVTCAPLVGVALARPILDLLGETHGAIRRQALGKLSGHYFEHKGHPFDIFEDENHIRWLRVSEVKRVISNLPSHQTLRKLHPNGVKDGGEPQTPRISAQTLVQVLERSTHPASLRFKVWLERVVIFPTRQLREPAPPDTLPSV
jgi:hypothetical protein